LNGSLRDELLNGDVFYTLIEAITLIERWRHEYNHSGGTVRWATGRLRPRRGR